MKTYFCNEVEEYTDGGPNHGLCRNSQHQDVPLEAQT